MERTKAPTKKDREEFIKSNKEAIENINKWPEWKRSFLYNNEDDEKKYCFNKNQEKDTYK